MVEGDGGVGVSKELCFGIDGGGSVSRLRIIERATPLEPLITVHGKSTNIFSVGREVAAENLSTLLQQGCSQLGIDPLQLVSGCMGSAGLGRKNEQLFFQEVFSRLLPHTSMQLCNDGEILLVGGVKKLEGYCLIAGTGSFALGRSRDGEKVRAGGHGYMLGDEGSAWWIADQAVRRTIRSHEGRDLETSMEASLLQYFELTELDGFVELFHHKYEKPKVARSAPIVTEFALRKDPLALDIITKAVDELVALLRSLYKRLPLIEPDLVLSGGVLENDPLIRPMVLSRLEHQIPQITVVTDTGSALDGACILAASNP